MEEASQAGCWLVDPAIVFFPPVSVTVLIELCFRCVAFAVARPLLEAAEACPRPSPDWAASATDSTQLEGGNDVKRCVDGVGGGGGCG